MRRKGITRRKFLAWAAGVGSFAIIGRARAAMPYKPSDSLIDAAKKEGKFTLYTATFTEVEQEVINEFRKKFPFVRIEMIREIGNLTSLKKAPLYPEGFDPKVVKVWVPKYDEFVKLQREWLDEWNKIYGYRQ